MLDCISGFRIVAAAFAIGLFFVSASTRVVAQEEVVVTDLKIKTNSPSDAWKFPNSSSIVVSEIETGTLTSFLVTERENGDQSLAKKELVGGLPKDANSIHFACLDNQTVAIGLGPKIAVYKIGSGTNSKPQSQIEDEGGVTSAKLTEFFGLTAGLDELFCLARNREEQWIVSIANPKASRPSRPERLVELAEVMAEGLVAKDTTLGPDGHLLVAASDTATSKNGLYFFSTEDKQLKASFDISKPAGLSAIAYSPTTKRLFALFQSKESPDTDGLYKLVARKRNTACEAQLIAKIASPKNMAFDGNGNLFVLSEAEGGRLLLVEGLE